MFSLEDTLLLQKTGSGPLFLLEKLFYLCILLAVNALFHPIPITEWSPMSTEPLHTLFDLIPMQIPIRMVTTDYCRSTTHYSILFPRRSLRRIVATKNKGQDSYKGCPRQLSKNHDFCIFITWGYCIAIGHLYTRVVMYRDQRLRDEKMAFLSSRPIFSPLLKKFMA